MPYLRALKKPSSSFFLFGPRGVGKSTWLNQHFANVPYFNLLKNETYLALSLNPSLIEAKIGSLPPESWICIDEIQKLPSLLDEVHRLMEEKKYQFALSGSSARKLKRHGANLLAGRAITRHMEGFSFSEIETDFDLRKTLEWGSLPLVVLKPEICADTLRAYVHTYLREEIKEEGLVRKVEPFVRFLEIAAIMNGQQLNVENMAREAKVGRPSVDTYISILEDTLIAHKLPAYRPKAKVREQTSPKLYWFDAGVARGAAGLLDDPVESTWLGTSLETLIFHELRVYNHTQNKNRLIAYYKTATGLEIDFVIETQKRQANQKAHVVCLEIKLARQWNRKWEKPMRSLKETGKVAVDRMIGIYGGDEKLSFDGFEVLSVKDFLLALQAGQIF
jgi:predicted AAA+ superfamily ATPase